jgi:hypothetical protein
MPQVFIQKVDQVVGVWWNLRAVVVDFGAVVFDGVGVQIHSMTVQEIPDESQGYLEGCLLLLGKHQRPNSQEKHQVERRQKDQVDKIYHTDMLYMVLNATSL